MVSSSRASFMLPVYVPGLTPGSRACYGGVTNYFPGIEFPPRGRYTDGMRFPTSPRPVLAAWLNWPLRRQFTASHLFLALFTVLVLSAILYVFQRQYVLGTFAYINQRRAASFASACEAARVQKDPAVLTVYMGLLRDSQDVEYAYYADAAGVIRAHFDPSWVGRAAADWKKQLDTTRFTVSAASLPRGGTVELGMQRAYAESLVQKSLSKVLLGVGSAALLATGLGLLLSFFLAARLTRPIRDLSRGTRAIGMGRFDIRVSGGTSREVQELADVFNGMAARLGELDRLKDDIFTMVTHDLRTPLASITSVIDVLREGGRGPLTPVQSDYLGIVRENVFALLRYVNDMLDMAKIKAGKVTYRMEAVDLSAVVERALQLFGTLAQQKGVALENEITPPTTVRADREKIDHIFANLISNALKHAPSEEGRVRVEVRPRDAFVEVRVIDNGPGLPEEGQDRLFQKFGVPAGSSPVRGAGR
ncbi:MAG: HAMP domain-containing histidine kinase [Elusimicrobia bacterium]|nr:MAG: HAMP domain-containing histidine kinase [Elusimicrobiota bacterium]